MAKADPQRNASIVQCAIYTRKSSDEGLEQEFNSLDAQREACAAFIKSQKHAGWRELPTNYDDGGISGGTMERPALKRLLEDIATGYVQIVVVYKVDRLTRSLADFAKIVDVLDAHRASFVSVTQQFNTTTSMGRLTLNMLLSFAQFEREISGERIRDKIAASKAKGMWMGGSVPLGYDVVDRKLVVNAAEAGTVRRIYRRFGKLGSVAVLKQELDRAGVVSKRRAGSRCSGTSLSRGALYTLLKNRLYLGQIVHQGKIYPGQHQAIVDTAHWEVVQKRLAASRKVRSSLTNTKAPSLLTGLLVDSAGNRMTPTYAVKSGRRYRYYVSTALITGSKDKCSNGERLAAGDVDAVVLDRLRAFFASPSELSMALAPLDLDANTMRPVLEQAAALSSGWPSTNASTQRQVARSVIERVEAGRDRFVIRITAANVLGALRPKHVAQSLSTDAALVEEAYTLTAEARLRRAGRGMRLVVGDALAAAPDQGLIKLIAKAFAVRDQMLAGAADSLEAMTRRLRTPRGYLAALIRLSWLAPDIVRAILEGRQPVGLNATRLLAAATTLPVLWSDQRRDLGFVAERAGGHDLEFHRYSTF